MKSALLAIIIFFVQILNTTDNVLVMYEGETVATVNRAEFQLILGTALINGEKLDEFINRIDKQIEKKPKNAMIDERGNLVSEQLGYKLDRKKFKEAFFTSFYNQDISIIEISTVPIYPKVDSELLANISVKQIGQYMTYFNHRKKGRAHNINLAAEAINNHVVFPEETFSFNEVVGQRTFEKGYKPAPVIIKGRIYKDFGGGICQVSSTLFNAVDRAELQVLQRYSHSKRVPYVPLGRDAQVSWYGADFTFKNIYNQPILIRAKVHGGILLVTIHSSDVINIKT